MIKQTLNELTITNVGQWPSLLKIVTIVFLSSLLFCMGYWVIVRENVTHYSTLKIQEDQLKNEFESKQYKASVLPTYREQTRLINKRFQRMLKQFSTKNEIPGLLEEISNIGITSGLLFESFTPMPEVTHDFYTELPIKIAVVGHYSQFSNFVRRIALMKRLITLHDFVMKRVDDKEQLQTERQLLMEITAKIYRYNTQ